MMNGNEFFKELTEFPKETNGVGVLLRMIDGTGFRLKWSLEELKNEFLNYQPSEDSVLVKDLLKHMLGLSQRITETLGGDKVDVSILTIEAYKNACLDNLLIARSQLLTLSDENLKNCFIENKGLGKKFDFWYLLNGPLADLLTHIGQITSWRRIYGEPIPKVKVFFGTV